MKPILFSILASVFFTATVAGAASYAVFQTYSRPAVFTPISLCVSSATTTNCGPAAFDVEFFDPDIAGQKKCLALPLTDASGYLYITAKTTGLSVSTTGCF